MSKCQTKAGNQECLTKLAKLTLSISHSLTLDMLNNFCFHVYAQKSVFIGQNVNVYVNPPHHHPLTLEFIELVPS